MKKRIYIFSTALLLIIGIFLVSEGNFKEKEANASKNTSENIISNKKIVEIEAKTDGFDDLNDLIEKSPIIVKGIRGEDVRTEVFTSKVDASVIIGGYTVADFKITEVIKNEVANVQINSENSIPIAELNFESEGSIYSVNGYEKMNENNEYLLFLVDEQDGVFATRGVTYGKVPLSSDELEIYGENTKSITNFDLIEDIFSDARNLYGN